MINVKMTLFAILLLTCTCIGISEGESLQIEINANSSDVEGKVFSQYQVYDASLNIGAGFLHSSNDYWISNLSIAIMDEIFISALTLGVGFDSSFGEIEIGDKDYDLLALGFLVTGQYDFRRISSVLSIPVCTYTSFSFSPDPLGFKDTTKYIKFTFGIDTYIVTNAAITVGYRYIEARFDIDPGELKRSEHAVFFGCKLIF